MMLDYRYDFQIWTDQHSVQYVTQSGFVLNSAA